MKNILLVDDKIDIQEILADFLRNNGHKTEACANGEQAIKRAKENEYDLIITDVIMPKKDGFSFLEELRSLNSEQEKKTPVIIITGGSTSLDFQDTLDTIQESGNKVLRKPFNKDQFIDAVNDSLGIEAEAV